MGSNALYPPLDYPLVVVRTSDGLTVSPGVPQRENTTSAEPVLVVDENLGAWDFERDECSRCLKTALANALLRAHRQLRQFVAGRRRKVDVSLAGKRIAIRHANGRFSVRAHARNYVDDCGVWDRQEAAALAGTLAALEIVAGRVYTAWCPRCEPELAVLAELGPEFHRLVAERDLVGSRRPRGSYGREDVLATIAEPRRSAAHPRRRAATPARCVGVANRYDARRPGRR